MPICAVDTGDRPIYSAFVSYTTPRPAAAMSGILLIGWSNAAIIH